MESSVFTMRIARKLADCEKGVDQLMADMATLLAEMATARAQCDSFGTGQRAIARVVDSQKSLANVQADILRAHADLLKIGHERGDLYDGECPPPKGVLVEAA